MGCINSVGQRFQPAAVATEGELDGLEGREEDREELAPPDRSEESNRETPSDALNDRWITEGITLLGETEFLTLNNRLALVGSEANAQWIVEGIRVLRGNNDDDVNFVTQANLDLLFTSGANTEHFVAELRPLRAAGSLRPDLNELVVASRQRDDGTAEESG